MEGTGHRSRTRGRGRGTEWEQPWQPSIQSIRGRGTNYNSQYQRGTGFDGNSASPGNGKKHHKPGPASEQTARLKAEVECQQASHGSFTQPFSPSSSNSNSRINLEPVSRPDAGGKRGYILLGLIVNHFHVSFHPSQQIFHYDVDMTLISPFSQQAKKSTVSRENAEEIKNKLFAENSSAMPVYDGDRKLYSSLRLPEGEFVVQLDDGKVKEYKVVLKLVKELDGRGLTDFLNSDITRGHVSVEKELLQAMGLVVREHPSRSRIIMGRSLFAKDPDDQGFLGGGAVATTGFSLSLRPTKQGLSLNVDSSVMTFHESIPVMEYLWESRGVDCWKNRALNPKDRIEAESALRDLKVCVTHRNTKQKFTVRGLTRQGCGELWFNVAERGEVEEKIVSLVSYYRQRHNVEIGYKELPCLDVSKHEGRPNYIPMELCKICEGQRYPKDDLNPYQSKRLRDVACPGVQQRVNLIRDIMNQADGPRGGPCLRRYKISVDSEMIHVTGRVLEAPQLRLGDSGKIREITPRPGDRKWNLLNSHVFEGKQIDNWGIVYFLRNPKDKGQKELMVNFCNALVARFRDLGIAMAETPKVRESDNISKLDNIPHLKTALTGIHTKTRGELQILICVMGKKHSGYKHLKLICEIDLGLLTQCCLFENVRRFQEAQFGPRYLGNLALKINAKCGGSNAALVRSPSNQFPRFGKSDHVVYFGADVNHPGKRDGKTPSIAAVVMSINWPHSTSYVVKIRCQKNCQEFISDLGDMCKELLDEYLKVNGKLPERIVFFRDGVSEGQFDMVLNRELVDLKMGFSRFGDAYNPIVSFIVAQKRHHTRLFPVGEAAKYSSRSGNVPPGTVVDTVIVHPREFDFYLCSHYGQLGTSKPTHYHVLWDENGFGSDELQGLVNDLCYTYARCTMPISLVPPVYYADLAAYKGRLYVEALTSSSSTAPIITLPKINPLIENKMFF